MFFAQLEAADHRFYRGAASFAEAQSSAVAGVTALPANLFFSGVL